MLNLAKQIFGSVNERKVRILRPMVQRINALEPNFEALSDEALRNKTSEYRHRLARGAKIDIVRVGRETEHPLNPVVLRVERALRRSVDAQFISLCAS